MKYIWLFIFLSTLSVKSQSLLQANPSEIQTVNDSIKKADFIAELTNGYFPTKYFNFDLRYLIKYNQYEGVRTGLGGLTNDNFSEKFRIQGYAVYGFLDHTFKYSIGGGFRIAPKTNTWINLFYTDDLEETGSSTFLTDKRFFQLFEPRLININLFHKHITKAVVIEHQLHPSLLTETQFSMRKITPTYDYSFNQDNDDISNYDLSLVTLSLQWDPFYQVIKSNNQSEEIVSGFPKFTFQYTKSFENFLNGDFSFSKFDFKAVQKFEHVNASSTEMILRTGLAHGDIPITHVYHANPNNVTKETVLRRFSVAGINSFETMYFNEFFSDKFATLILRHKLKPFNFSPNFRPQLVVLTKLGIGTMDETERHQNISFDTLEKGFTESGIEINKLLFGFGLSFAYRYGAYHLPKFEDNIALKFTFNLTIDPQ